MFEDRGEGCAEGSARRRGDDPEFQSQARRRKKQRSTGRKSEKREADAWSRLWAKISRLNKMLPFRWFRMESSTKNLNLSAV